MADSSFRFFFILAQTKAKNKKSRQPQLPGIFLEVTTRFELVDEGFADPCLTTWPRHHIRSDCYHSIGAADEARTRYLHLGKVALYQMSYGRIFGAFIPAPPQNGAPAKACEARFCGEEEEFQRLSLKSCVARFPDKRLTFRRSDPDRARTDDPQRDRLVL